MNTAEACIGWAAALGGKPRVSTYPEGSIAHAEWLRGYDDYIRLGEPSAPETGTQPVNTPVNGHP